MKLTDKQRRKTKRNSKLLINNTSTDDDYRYRYGKEIEDKQKEIVQLLKNKEEKQKENRLFQQYCKDVDRKKKEIEDKQNKEENQKDITNLNDKLGEKQNIYSK